jgi:hypothetical protein
MMLDTGYHTVTLEDVEAAEEELAELAENDRYIDRSMGYNFEDYLCDVEQNMRTGTGQNWDLGTQLTTPVIKAIHKIYRRTLREMREG